MEHDEIDLRFAFHPTTVEQAERMDAIRAEAHAFALMIVDRTPASREQSLALTALEEVVMWANAAIARRERV